MSSRGAAAGAARRLPASVSFRVERVRSSSASIVCWRACIYSRMRRISAFVTSRSGFSFLGGFESVSGVKLPDASMFIVVYINNRT